MTKRSLSTVLVLALVATSLLVAPFEAGAKKKKKGCRAGLFADAAADAPVVKVTDAHTAEAPLVQAFSL